MNRSITTKNDYPILPEDIFRDHVRTKIQQAASLIGISGGALQTLLAMIDMTAREDWISHEREPVFFMEQTAFAAQRGLTDRRIRHHEAELEQLGLIDKATAANGRRGSFREGAIRLGLSLTPLIERYSEISNLADQFSASLELCRSLRQQCSAARRQLTKNLSRLEPVLGSDHAAMVTLYAAQNNLPRRYSGLTVEAMQAAFDAAHQAALQSEKLVTDHIGRKLWTVEAEENFRPLIQDTTQISIESCKANPDQEPAGEDEREDCLEESELEKRHAMAVKIGQAFSAEDLMKIASDEMRDYLEVHAAYGLTPYTFSQAARHLWRDWQFSMSALDEAQSALGEFGAALAVLIITANRVHPTKPVLNPSALMQTFAKLARQGDLNLLGSLIGLYRRKVGGLH